MYDSSLQLLHRIFFARRTQKNKKYFSDTNQIRVLIFDIIYVFTVLRGVKKNLAKRRLIDYKRRSVVEPPLDLNFFVSGFGPSIYIDQTSDDHPQ